MNRHFNVSYELNNNILGCVGHRRREFNKNDYDYCITFDSDIDFDPKLLKSFLLGLDGSMIPKIKINKETKIKINFILTRNCNLFINFLIMENKC